MWPISTFRFLTSSLAGALAASLAALPAATSAEDFDDMSCRNGGFAGHENFRTAQITGGGRAYLLDDMDGCPDAESAPTMCRAAGSPYLIEDDIVLVSRLRMDHACVYFPNEGGGSAGYVPLSRLRLWDHDLAPSIDKWLGDWSNFGNPAVSITLDGDTPKIKGEAYWPGRFGTHDYPATHVGMLDGRLRILGNQARYDDGECVVRFTLAGDFLIAGDNFRCGGMNVRFRDVMTRSSD